MPNPKVAAVSRLLYRSVGHTHTSYSDRMVARARKPVISTQSVDFKAPHSAKTQQAWRYPGGKIVRASTTRLNSDPRHPGYTDPKHPGENMPRRKHESNFFITINSNKAPETTEHVQLAVQHMEQMLKMLSDESVLSTYLRFGPKDPSYENDKYADVVHSVDWKAAVETGDKLNRVHAHIWLTITHYSQIQINIQMLMWQARKHYNRGMGLVQWSRGKDSRLLHMEDFPYVHVKLLPQSDWTDVMRQYIHKGMLGA